MHEVTWRQYYQPIIADVLARYPEDSPERRKALRDAYPAGERRYWPYKVWLDEIAIQTGRKKKKKVQDKSIPGWRRLLFPADNPADHSAE